ncbi:MAG: HAD hydrolase family protein [Halobacteriales archaeon]|nr:HAD hydrolase family protein [Halobacteriales archaeon]
MPDVPPRPPHGRAAVVASDFDRTFTRPDLTVAPEAVARARELRRRGVRLVFVTGKTEQEFPWQAVAGAFDAVVLEGGAVWGWPRALQATAAPPALLRLGRDLAAEGHDVRRGVASLSVPLAAGAALERLGAELAWRVNWDRIDVTPRGIDKGTGLRAALALLGLAAPWVLAVGDGANDLPLFAAADATVAVANADSGLQAASDAVAPAAAHHGFLWAVSAL